MPRIRRKVSQTPLETLFVLRAPNLEKESFNHSIISHVATLEFDNLSVQHRKDEMIGEEIKEKSVRSKVVSE